MSETSPDDSPQPKSRPVNKNQGINRSGVERFSLKDLQVATDDFSPNTNIRHESEKKNLGIDLNKLEIFSLEDLKVATDKFSHKNIIGRGGSGAVYKGRLSDGSLVAIKRLSIKCTQSVVEFQTEVEMISRAVHRKLLRPRGYFSTPEERILVYPFMPNGSVASCLFERSESQPPLSWELRKQIAFGAARGLTYLHEDFDPKIIHRDVKASNIFLDEEFEAVVGDFGLSKPMDFKDNHVSTYRLAGTFGYMAPEYFINGEFSEKTDIFGYGIMLLELVSGQKASYFTKLANEEDGMLQDWV